MAQGNAIVWCCLAKSDGSKWRQCRKVATFRGVMAPLKIPKLEPYAIHRLNRCPCRFRIENSLYNPHD